MKMAATSSKTKLVSLNISTYDYGVNALSQRHLVEISGTAFGTTAVPQWGLRRARTGGQRRSTHCCLGLAAALSVHYNNSRQL